MKSYLFSTHFSFLGRIVKLAALFYILVEVVRPAEETGPKTKYEIPSYYGSRDKDFDIKGFAIASNYSSFFWSHGVDIDDQTAPGIKKFYVIDSNESMIKQITDAYEVTEIVSTSGGFRNGDIKNSLFDSAEALVFFRQNKYDAARSRYKKIFILSNDSTSCKQQLKLCQDTSQGDSTECRQLLSTCQDTSLTDNSTINLNRLAEYYDIPSVVKSKLPSNTDYLNEVLIVADTKNHCIRKIDLVTKLTTTIAGKCTVKGFKDGPLGTNLMHSPSSLGVDEQGIIFFYDGEYDYIRMVDPITTFVSTLLKGACREDIRYTSKQIFQNMQNKRVICYKNWLNINADPKDHKYEENLLSICQLQQSLCTTTKTSDTAT